MSRAKSSLLLLVILLITALAGFFIYPQSPFSNVLPWKLGLDLVGGSYLIYEVNLAGIQDRSFVMNGLRDVIEKRVNLFGVSEPRVTISQSGESNRLNVELAGVNDVSAAIKQIGETPLLYFAEVELPESKDKEPLFKSTELTGRYIKGASLGFNQVNLPTVVNLEFNSEGAAIFESITERNVGKELAVILDGEVVEIARVNEKISGGRAQISGINNPKDAKKLVERLNAGALPAPIKLIHQQTVGASLGRDSLQKTVWAGIWGTLALMLFMILYYRNFGVFSAIALFIYVILTLAMFKLFTVTMTLAGIAGFILSIGMAVDANILIFERIKEELKQGASRVSALENGFNRAWTSIRDSNFTTMLTTFILFYFTTSFVKGFALTLFIGVVVSMFSAITVTRILLNTFINPSPFKD
ncbi:MAG: protein-export membrane protein SecD [Candidatus Harrisonbacteria bacterium RIFCSPLOWO2_02_FULL_41_11]|uniref:Protein translocase subunit SecD n=1 Tax=Candidatus Harrisonbacteria bacterium RIFCSPHIGHO2_02_FULL_42_16 TaxID=1798404 RepID=A0A1G1ZFK3_9BACT|nr:MAG: protein-export membrane protein SecD [Candidatus Harrisonbacteria bacterium RIFCSPHIGHO2_02_FULL_42_16]OGY66722.1 MAG: protein-export membrane protein SecD [Candidatus Harrisonbacteria bacterium RIFCSPLOWO2_02_FULL_41_11]